MAKRRRIEKRRIEKRGISDRDRHKVHEWIWDVFTEENGGKLAAIYRTRALFDQFMERRPETKKSKYQLACLGAIYVSSCLFCPFPWSLDVLHALCDEAYDRSTIRSFIFTFLKTFSPRDTLREWSVEQAEMLKHTEHVMVYRTPHNTVCKRIPHHYKLPNLSAVSEIMAQHLVSSVHFVRLLFVHFTEHDTVLHFEYVPYGLKRFMGKALHVVRPLVCELVAGVNAFHNSGLSHRDLKGDNIHVTANNELRLLDAGCVGFSKIRSTMPICTLTHRSPELLCAARDGYDSEYDYNAQKLDVWSVGVLICELYLGPDPFGRIFEGTAPGELLQKIEHRCEHVLTQMKLLLSEPQFLALKRCLSPLPVDRPTMQQLSRAFPVQPAHELAPAARQ